MTLHPLARSLGIAILALAGAASAAPAFAVSDVDLLKEYVGDWRGRGQVTGSTQETIVCRMSLVAGNQDKVNYTGRCTMAGHTLAMNGTVAYLEDKKQFVAAMSSNASFGGQAIGQKRGNSIVFTMQGTEKDQEGKTVNVTSRMTFAGGKITTDFKVVYPETGDTLSAKVPFSR